MAFLTLFWLNALLTGEYVFLGWVFLAARTYYLVLARFCIRPWGIKPLLLSATMPGYGVLFFYIYNVARALL